MDMLNFKLCAFVSPCRRMHGLTSSQCAFHHDRGDFSRHSGVADEPRNPRRPPERCLRHENRRLRFCQDTSSLTPRARSLAAPVCVA